MATVRASVPFWRVHVFGTNGSAEARDEDTLRVGYIGKDTQEQTFAKVDSLRAMAEAFADAVERRTPFLITPRELVDAEVDHGAIGHLHLERDDLIQELAELDRAMPPMTFADHLSGGDI